MTSVFLIIANAWLIVGFVTGNHTANWIGLVWILAAGVSVIMNMKIQKEEVKKIIKMVDKELKE